MKQTNVSSIVLERLADELGDLTPETRKAATYVLENPRDVGVSTVREIAEAANVKPNTVVRMARQVGFEGYEDFREPFREAIRSGSVDFPDRARWLQEIRKTGDLGGLYADMVQGALLNIENTFSWRRWVFDHYYLKSVNIRNTNLKKAHIEKMRYSKLKEVILTKQQFEASNLQPHHKEKYNFIVD